MVRGGGGEGLRTGKEKQILKNIIIVRDMPLSHNIKLLLVVNLVHMLASRKSGKVRKVAQLLGPYNWPHRSRVEQPDLERNRHLILLERLPLRMVNVGLIPAPVSPLVAVLLQQADFAR